MLKYTFHLKIRKNKLIFLVSDKDKTIEKQNTYLHP